MMNNRRLTVFTVLVFLLFLAGNVVNATVPYTDEKNDVFYYENGIVDRANDPHTPADVPEVDIHSLNFEVSTEGTTVFLHVGGEFIEEFVDGYDYTFRIYQGETNDFDYYHLWTNMESNVWSSWFNSNEHHTYSFDEGTLSIFFEGMFLDASTVYFEATARHYHSDGGIDADWYPDGVEKQSGLDTSTVDNGDGSEDESDNTDNTDGDNSLNTDNSNDGGSSSDTPGFEYPGVILAIALVILFVRRR
jgi:hypothetical protein